MGCVDHQDNKFKLFFILSLPLLYKIIILFLYVKGERGNEEQAERKEEERREKEEDFFFMRESIY
jgi:hypothetical protein